MSKISLRQRLENVLTLMLAIAAYYAILLAGYSSLGLIHYGILPPLSIPVVLLLVPGGLLGRNTSTALVILISCTTAVRYFDRIYNLQIADISDMTPDSVISMILKPLAIQLCALSCFFIVVKLTRGILRSEKHIL